MAEGKSRFHLQLQHLALEAWMGRLLLCSGAGSRAAGAGEPGWGVGDAREEQHGSVLGCGMGLHLGCTWGGFVLCCQRAAAEGFGGVGMGNGQENSHHSKTIRSWFW